MRRAASMAEFSSVAMVARASGPLTAHSGARIFSRVV
jgi:hypothetical protein